MTQERNHRADIDGLRAVAVLSVIVADVSSRWLPGGYFGIDVFFVVSGFLVSSIMLGGLERGSFDLREFYSARLRRVLPALLTVLAVVLVLGWFLLFAGEYRELGKQVAAGVTFLSNFVLWRENAALGDAAPSTVLLHLWSLAVGAQFVVVWPLLLMLAWKRRPVGIVLLAALLVVSFAASLVLVRYDPAAAYYSPLTRAWELMVGALLAHLQQRGWRWHEASAGTASALGLALLIAGIVLVHPRPGGPGAWVLLPTIGTFLVLSAPPQTWLNRRVFGHWALAAIGLVSYPLFLWHWPLLAFARIVESGPPSPNTRIGVLLLTLLAAVATTLFVERPLRRRERLAPTAATLAGLTLAVGAIGGICLLAGGLPGTGYRDSARQDFVDRFEERDAPAVACEFPNVAPDCTTRDPARRHAVLLWGDTHARQLYDGLSRNLPADWQILRVTSPDCYPAAYDQRAAVDDRCKAFNALALEAIARARPDVVIMAQDRWQFIRVFQTNAVRLKALGVGRTLFAGPTPHWTAPLPTVVARNLWPAPPNRTLVGVDRQILYLGDVLRTHFTTSDSMAFVDIIDLFCNPGGCLTYLGDDPATGLTSGDDAHLTPIASDYLARNMLVRMVIGSVGE